MDLCAYMYGASDPGANNLLDVLIIIMLMNVEVGGDIFPTFR